MSTQQRGAPTMDLAGLTEAADSLALALPLESPTAQVLRTPELLEDILSYLLIRDLLLSQRTSRNFRNIIKGSPKLQRMLFFLPEVPHGQEMVINPLLCQKRGSIRQAYVVWLMPGPKRIGDRYEPLDSCFRFNNNLYKPGELTHIDATHHIRWEYPDIERNAPRASDRNIDRSSLGQMYLSQPPTKVQMVGKAGRYALRNTAVPPTFETEGPRLGEIFTEVERLRPVCKEKWGIEHSLASSGLRYVKGGAQNPGKE